MINVAEAVNALPGKYYVSDARDLILLYTPRHNRSICDLGKYAAGFAQTLPFSASFLLLTGSR